MRCSPALNDCGRMSRSPGARIRDNKYQLPKTNYHQDSLLLRFRCSHFSRQMLISISKPQMETLADLAQQYLKFPSDTAFVGHRGYRTIRRTYRQTAETAFRFARELEERGIGKGDRVVLWGDNSPEWVAAFAGIMLPGAVAVPMDRIAPPEFIHPPPAHFAANLSFASCVRADHWHVHSSSHRRHGDLSGEPEPERSY